jgi:uncharacterized phage protein (TIGR02216 family)
VFSESARRLAGASGALLGWRPDEFWHSTPAELAAVLEAIGGSPGRGEAPSRHEIEQLLERFPD